MRPKTPEIIKDAVIGKWLQGNSRNKSARLVGTSQGNATAIIKEWCQLKGKDVLTQYRDLSLAMAKTGLDPVKCAKGLRVVTLMRNLGVDEDDCEVFLLEVYSSCIARALRPQHIAGILHKVLSLSERLNSPSDIFDYLSKLKEQIQSMKRRTALYEESIQRFHAEREVAEELRDLAFNESRVTQETLNWYLKLKEEMSKYGMPVDDVSEFAKTIQKIRLLGYDPLEITTLFSNHQTMKYALQNMEQNISIKEAKFSELEHNKESLEEALSNFRFLLSQVEELNKWGITGKDLKVIQKTVNEIAAANHFPTKDGRAFKKLMSDILTQYDLILGFEASITKLRVEIKKLVFLKHDLLSDRLEYVVDVLRKLTGDNQKQKQTAANILNDYPDLIGPVASKLRDLNVKSTDSSARPNANSDLVNNMRYMSKAHVYDQIIDDCGDIAGFASCFPNGHFEGSNTDLNSQKHYL